MIWSYLCSYAKDEMTCFLELEPQVTDNQIFPKPYREVHLGRENKHKHGYFRSDPTQCES